MQTKAEIKRPRGRPKKQNKHKRIKPEDFWAWHIRTAFNFRWLEHIKGQDQFKTKINLEEAYDLARNALTEALEEMKGFELKESKYADLLRRSGFPDAEEMARQTIDRDVWRKTKPSDAFEKLFVRTCGIIQETQGLAYVGEVAKQMDKRIIDVKQRIADAKKRHGGKVFGKSVNIGKDTRNKDREFFIIE